MPCAYTSSLPYIEPVGLQSAIDLFSELVQVLERRVHVLNLKICCNNKNAIIWSNPEM